MKSSQTAPRLPWFAVLLFLSGMAGLLFETLWLRVSGLVFGNSVWSAALILSSFMAGLALGNLITAASKLRAARALRLYALLELAVAAFGCLVVFAIPLLGSAFRSLFEALWMQQSLLAAVRLALSFLILLVPTTAMGMTLPVLLEDPLLAKTRFARAFAILYGCNTLGAVAGALLGELFLIAAFGIGGTAVAAAVCSAAAAAVAWLLAGRTVESKLASPPLALSTFYDPPWRLLVISFGAGAVLLCLEVIWFRILSLYIISTSTAFAVMLAIVLAGIALGGLLAGVMHRLLAGARQSISIVLLLSAVVTLLTYICFPGASVRAKPGPFQLVSFAQIVLLSGALVLPVALLSGTIFPCVVARVQTQVGDRMHSTGITTLFNTAGCAVGPLVASFLLLPSVGFQSSLVICAAAYALLALVGSERASWSPWRPSGLILILSTIVFVALLFLFSNGRAETHFREARTEHEIDERAVIVAHPIARVEGNAETYQLLRRDLFGQPYYYRLLTNAFSMSATNPRNQRYMRLFAYLPIAFNPVARDALLICYGCGVTADAFTRDGSLQRIDIVDTSKEVLALADRYVGIGYRNPLRDQRVNTFVQDGRFFLQAAPRHYDIISGEPPPPKVAGSVNLYTQEFFSLMHSRLNDGGIATFWLPLDQLKIQEAKAILRAFHNAFANCSVWAAPDEQWIMMGIKGVPHSITEAGLRRLWDDKATRDDLVRIGVEVPQQLGALFVMDNNDIDGVTRDTAPLADFYPKRLSDASWDERANEDFAKGFFEPKAAFRRFSESPLIQTIWPEAWRKPVASLFTLREMRYLSSTSGSNMLAELDVYLRSSRLRTPVLEVLQTNEFRLALAESASATSQNPSPDALPDLVAGALAKRDYANAIKLIETERELGAFESTDLYLLAYLYCMNGEVHKAEQLVGTNNTMIAGDWFSDWLWAKLKKDFGFQPPF